MKLPDENIVYLPDNWPDPLPLPEARPQVQAFDPAMLPEVVRPWVEDISERIQCPPDYAGIGVMVALSALIGRSIGIRPKQYDDWTVVPNLWGAVIGRPGIMKTPALQDAMRPVRHLEVEALEQFRSMDAEHQAETKVRAAQDKEIERKLSSAVKKGNRQEISELKAEIQSNILSDEKPACRRYETNDTSVEKLGELLAENPRGLLVFRDELTGWLRSLDQEQYSNARAFFLEAWNGTGGYTYDRIGRGTVRIEAACVSILGGIQPGPLSAYVHAAQKHGRGNDGLLQRFQLLVYPDEPRNWRNVDRWPNREAKNSAFSGCEYLAHLKPGDVEANSSDGVPYLRFDPSAQDAFNSWLHELQTVKLTADQPEVIEAHLSKYRSLVPSLALISHLADRNSGPVGDAAINRAIEWAGYLESHIRRVYGIALDDSVSAVALAGKIVKGRVCEQFRPKDVYDRGWRNLDRDQTWRAVETLESLHWLRVEEVRSGGAGRPSYICHLNPRLNSENA